MLRKQLCFLVLLIFVAFEFIKSRGIEMYKTFYQVYDSEELQETAFTNCNRNSTTLVVLKQRNEIVHFKKWMLNAFKEFKGCSLIF